MREFPSKLRNMMGVHKGGNWTLMVKRLPIGRGHLPFLAMPPVMLWSYGCLQFCSVPLQGPRTAKEGLDTCTHLLGNVHQLCHPLSQPFSPDVLHDNHIKIFALPLPFDHTSKEDVSSQPSSSSYLTQTREEGRLWYLSTSPDDREA